MRVGKAMASERRTLAILILFLVVISSAGATQFYVAPTGSDSADGSIGTPFRTIQKGMSNAQAGDTIYLRGGIYYNSTTIQPPRSGLAGQVINLWAYPGESPILDFSGQPYSSGSRGIYLSKSYWSIKGLTVRFAGDNGIYITGQHNTVEGCTLYGNKDTGLQISGGGGYNIIINSDSYDNYDSLTHGGNADGFDAKLSIGPGNEFHGCRAFDNSDDGFDMYEGQNRVIIDSCWSFHNGYNLWGDPSFQGNGNGFKLGGNYIPGPHWVAHSVAFDNSSKGFDQNHTTAGVTLYNNTSWRNVGRNFSFPETTAVGRDTLINNVSWQGSVTIERNALQITNSWQGHTVSASDFLSSDTSLARVPRNPDGSLPATDFLRLAPGSSLIDSGTIVGFPFRGSAPDLGAFESGSTVIMYPITATTGGHGTTVPSGTIAVASGDSIRFLIVPDTGYHVADVVVDGSPVGVVDAYVFPNVTSPHTIAVYFSINTYTITASAGPHGSIIPSGSVIVPYGGDTAFAINPATGYHVDSVTIDGSYAGTMRSAAFTHVTTDHSLGATFAINRYILTVTATNGTVTRNPDLAEYDTGATVQLTAVPAAGYEFLNWTGDILPAQQFDNPLTLFMDTSKAVVANFAASTHRLPVDAGWNMISLPCIVADGRKSTLFPEATSSAYFYTGSYVVEDTLQNGQGYWLKFPAADTIAIGGAALPADTIVVTAGWNMISSIASPVSSLSIVSEPPAMVTSQFIGYRETYILADTLYPGRGYWVRVSSGGNLILSASPGNLPSSARIRIVPTSELPPAHPAWEGQTTRRIPSEFGLDQNYPNPFNPATTIEYSLPVRSRVALSIYDMLGRLVATLVDGVQDAGVQTVRWDAASRPSGIYICRLTAEGFVQSRVMVLLK